MHKSLFAIPSAMPFEEPFEEFFGDAGFGTPHPHGEEACGDPRCRGALLCKRLCERDCEQRPTRTRVIYKNIKIQNYKNYKISRNYKN